MLRFDTLYEDYEWEVFSAYVTSTDFYYIETAFGSDEDWLEFINELKGKSLYQTDVTLSADDVVLTLSTCSYEFDGARFVVHARLIK
jgi:sortase B